MAVSTPDASAVQEITSCGILTVDAIRNIIEDAALMVAGCVSGLDPSTQQSIVKYVAAHIISTTGLGGAAARRTSKRLGDAAESYATPTFGANLSGSSFGQMAIALDPSGCLATLGQRPAFFEVLTCR